MKNMSISITTLLVGLTLAFGANQAFAQNEESKVVLQEVSAKTSSSIQDSQFDNTAPNEGISNAPTGCWSDYLRQLYQQDSNDFSGELFATRDLEK
jgi:hypothetical protein